jgi:hypothetical protein
VNAVKANLFSSLKYTAKQKRRRMHIQAIEVDYGHQLNKRMCLRFWRDGGMVDARLHGNVGRSRLEH